MKSITPSPPRHGPSGEFINNDDLAGFDNITDILHLELLGLRIGMVFEAGGDKDKQIMVQMLQIMPPYLEGIEDERSPLGARVIEVRDLKIKQKGI